MFDICFNMSDGHNNPFRSYQTVGIQSPYNPLLKSVECQQSKRVEIETDKSMYNAAMLFTEVATINTYPQDEVIPCADVPRGLVKRCPFCCKSRGQTVVGIQSPIC